MPVARGVSSATDAGPEAETRSLSDRGSTASNPPNETRPPLRYRAPTLYRIDWKLADAERLYVRVLEMRERALGPDHPDVAETLLNLERTYLGLGKHGEADRVHRRAATIVPV